MIELIHHLLLASPTATEIIDDRKGDPHKDKKDITVRIFLVVVLSLLSAALHSMTTGDWSEFWWWLSKCVCMSTAYFVLFFDYGVNIAQRDVTERKEWWLHLNSKSWPDNWKPWIAIGWEWRMVIKVLLFGLAVLYYF